ncbi:MAG: hypothetical protein ABIO45_17305 [Burkholderiaceae bacterium]
MGLTSRLRVNLGNVRAALRPMRERGLGLRAALVWLPLAMALRAWRALAGPLNARLLKPWFNAARFAAFQQALRPAAGMPLYVIVMPHTLHFLLPCLALLHGRAPLVLVANGARRWERAMLRRRLPELPMFTLRTLPLSSLPHGDAISLMIDHHRGDFGIVDHDAYIFDATLPGRLQPAADECMVAVFAQSSQRAGIAYPLTHVLAFQAEPLRRLMHAHGIDARSYRQPPAAAAAALRRIGLGRDDHFKDYQTFHDTLHVLLAVALVDGLKVRFEPQPEGQPVFHVGGTSIGSHHTKNLLALHIHLRFLELLDDPELRKRYAFLTYPLRGAVEALGRGNPMDAAWQTLPVVDDLLARLRAAGAGHGFRAGWDITRSTAISAPFPQPID